MKKFLLITLISSLHDGMPMTGHFIKWGYFRHKLTHFFKSWNCCNSLHCLKPLGTKTWLPWVTEWCLQSSTEAYLSLTKIVMILTWDFFEIFNEESSATFIYFVFCAELYGVVTLNQQVHQATFAECLLKWSVVFCHPWNDTVRTNSSFFKVCHHVLPKGLCQILVNFCGGRGQERCQ